MDTIIEYWRSPTGAGTIWFLHGAESHSQWFTPLVEELSPQVPHGLLGIDRAGWGKSPKPRGVPEPLNVTIKQAIHVISSKSVGPVHLVGMSWGGLFAAVLAQRLSPRSVTLIAPGIFQRRVLKQALQLATALMRRDHFTFDFTPADFSSRRGDFVAQDPLRILSVHPRFCLQTLWLQQLTRVWLRKPNVPAAIHLATNDRIIHTPVTAAHSRELKQYFYPDSAHSIPLDEPTQLAQNIASWLNELEN